jgi:hypothetical protein
MPYQRASHPHPVVTSHEPLSLISVQLPRQALEEQQDSSLESPAVPQAIQSSQSSNASHEDLLLAFIRLPEQALDEEQEYGLESPGVSQTTQSNRSSSLSYEVPLFTCNQPPSQALAEEQESVNVSLKRPSRSFDNGQQIPALEITRGELFYSVSEECVRPIYIEEQRSRTTRLQARFLNCLPVLHCVNCITTLSFVLTLIPVIYAMSVLKRAIWIVG